MRPSALILSPEAPYPMIGGGAIRTASLIEYLARRYSLDLVVFREPGAPDPRDVTPRGLIENLDVLNLPSHSKHLLPRVARNARRLLLGKPPLIERFGGFDRQIAAALSGRRYDLALIEHFWCAPYRPLVAAHARRVVLDLHNVDSALYRILAQTENWPGSFASSLFSSFCVERERYYLPQFSALLVTSDGDAAEVSRAVPGLKSHVYPNALPVMTTPSVPEQNVVAFSGNLEYLPNVTAVRYFSREIWPALRARFPGLVWRIIGKNPEFIAKYVHDDERIQVTGPVEDAVKELASALVVVVPLLAGSGTRLKILEAWTAARAVVATSIGAAGLGAIDGEHLILSDTPQTFLEAVSLLIDSPAERTRLARAGHELLDSQFTWPRAWETLEQIGI